MHRATCLKGFSSVLLSAFFIAIGLTAPAGADETLAKLRYPLSKSEGIRTPNFVLDLSEVTDNESAKVWGAEAKVLCEEWFPVLCRFLSTEKWTPPETVRLVLKKDLDAPGVTSGGTIQFSVKWITDHPDDFGMVIHELTHIVQNYPPGKMTPGWLVEGIADYIRYWKYEPEMARPQIDRQKSNYRQGYGTTGAFLAWMVRKYDRRIVLRLDAALRTQTYKPDLFRELTGKDLDELWGEFIAQVAPSR
jgi:hypothetical protein